MSELIKREDAVKATWHEPSYTDPYNVLTEVRDRIEALPTVDFTNVIRSRLTEIRDKLLTSICEYCDTTAEERLKDELCENCPLTSLIREAFDEQ